MFAALTIDLLSTLELISKSTFLGLVLFAIESVTVPWRVVVFKAVFFSSKVVTFNKLLDLYISGGVVMV